jgi:hypothetical protein
MSLCEHGGINQIQVFPGYFGGLEIRLGASWFYQKLKYTINLQGQPGCI